MAVTFCVNTIKEAVDEIIDANKENKKIIDVKEFSDKFSDHFFSTPLQQIIPEPFGDGESETDKTEGKLLKELFKKAYKDNKVVKEIMDAKACSLQKLLTVLIKKGIVLSIKDLKIENKQLYVKNRMYVLENEALQLHLLQQHHNFSIHGYTRYKAMYQKIQVNYFWFEIAKHCKKYASNCSMCTLRAHGRLQKQS